MFVLKALSMRAFFTFYYPLLSPPKNHNPKIRRCPCQHRYNIKILLFSQYFYFTSQQIKSSLTAFFKIPYIFSFLYFFSYFITVQWTSLSYIQILLSFCEVKEYLRRVFPDNHWTFFHKICINHLCLISWYPLFHRLRLDLKLYPPTIIVFVFGNSFIKLL
mgnify:CR=1 FL=1